MPKHRCAPILGLLLVVPSMLGLAAPASAASTPTSSSTPPSTTTDAGTPLGSGVAILGATITTANQPTRKLNGVHAAAFVQAWLPESIFGKPEIQAPPENLPVSHVSVPYRFNGLALPPMLIYYASDGQTAWVGMPRQALWAGAFVSKLSWIVAPDRTIAAFAGKLLPVPVLGNETTTTTTTTVAGTASRSIKHDSSSSSLPWIALVVAFVLGTGLAVLATTRRRRARVV